MAAFLSVLGDHSYPQTRLVSTMDEYDSDDDSDNLDFKPSKVINTTVTSNAIHVTSTEIPAISDDSQSEVDEPASSPPATRKRRGLDEDAAVYTEPSTVRPVKRARQKERLKKSAVSEQTPDAFGNDDEVEEQVYKRITKRSGLLDSVLANSKAKKSTKKKSKGPATAAEDPTGTLPPGLIKRRKKWAIRRKRSELDLSLLLPPDYDEIHFSDDERLDKVKERPVFTHVEPQRAYEDIEIKTSSTNPASIATKILGTIPASIAKWLRKYQIEGAAFLHDAFVHQEGVILGDDMGLGKTIQVISFLTAAFGKTGDERDAKRMRKMRRHPRAPWYPRVLIVCPSGLIPNWKQELDRWGWWTVYTYHGSEKQDALEAALTGRLEIMLTTYATYSKDAEEINSVQWDCVIADECHIIKNITSKTTVAMNDVNAMCRIGLTGTAIQNNYEELWTLLNWTNPGVFGPLSVWKSTICDPLRAGQSHEAVGKAIAIARNTAEELVNEILPPYFLRRLKSLIADQLPKKSDRVVFCPLTGTQAQAYDNMVNGSILMAVRNASQPCSCGSGKRQGWCCHQEVNGRPWIVYMFPALVVLQKIANHLALMVPSIGTDAERHDKDLEFLKVAVPDIWHEMYTHRDSVANYAEADFCGKWRVLLKMLKLWYEQRDKVLIFSHSKRLLKMLQRLFQMRTSYSTKYIDGDTPPEDRQKTVDEFNSSPDEFVFLISTRAGGVGLNITSANKVVVVDPNWNPAWDLQAQDRAYRIGQTRDVDVFRLVSAGTIEENIYARQVYKQQQANIGYNASVERRYFKGVQNDKENQGEIFGIANLLAPHTNNVVLQEIVNKTNIAETKAGVQIAGLDMESYKEVEIDDDVDVFDQDKAMSELALSILDETGGKRRKAQQRAKPKSAIEAVLASAGVTYSHENTEVIGTSKIEQQISARARKLGVDAAFARAKAFADASQLEADVDVQSGSNDGDDALESVKTIRPRYKYNPPEDVRVRQFCSMAKAEGYDNMSEFALVVEGMTQQERRMFLDKWYKRRREVLLST